VGSIPFGFTLAADGVHFVLDRHEQTIILRARSLRSRGLSFRAVAARLAAEGRTNRKGRPFFATQVARMLGHATTSSRFLAGSALAVGTVHTITQCIVTVVLAAAAVLARGGVSPRRASRPPIVAARDRRHDD
jgi:hypothetical protein